MSAGHWDRVAMRFAGRRHYLDGFLSEMKRRAYLELFERWAGSSPRRVLKTDLFEEATDAGVLLDALAEHGAQVYGMDVSPTCARQAAARIEDARGKVLAGDARRLPFGAGSFDLVVSPSTLDHFPDPNDLGVSLREIARVLAPDGRLIITLDNRQNVTDWMLRLARRLGLVPYFLGRSYAVSELEAELERVGLEVSDTAAILHNPRLFAVGAVALARRLPFRGANAIVRSTLESMQRFGSTRWRFRTGSFVAACAVQRADERTVTGRRPLRAVGPSGPLRAGGPGRAGP